MDSIPNYHPYGDYNIELHDLTNQMDKAAAERLIEILRASPIPLSTRDLGARLRLQKIGIPDYLISRLLRDMIQGGRVEFRKGPSTTALSAHPRGTLAPHVRVPRPALSPEILARLGWKLHRPFKRLFHFSNMEQMTHPTK